MTRTPLPYQAVIFDLDGTLINSQAAITLSVQHALREIDIIEDDPTRLTRFIGPPLQESFKRYYDLNDAMTQRAVETYREHFGQYGVNLNTVYDGIAQLLWILRASHVELAIATTKYQNLAETVLLNTDLRHYFGTVVGGTDEGQRSTKSGIVAAALNGISVERRGNAVMVGDYRADVEGARANEIAAIAVTYGFGDPDDLRAAGPDHIVGSVTDLRAVLIGNS